MVAFKQMWVDVCSILNNEQSFGMEVVETFNSGFTIKEQESTTFITRDDFVDFWCKLLYFNEISVEQIYREGTDKQKYIYEIVKNLPYVNENEGTLTLLA